MRVSGGVARMNCLWRLAQWSRRLTRMNRLLARVEGRLV